MTPQKERQIQIMLHNSTLRFEIFSYFECVAYKHNKRKFQMKSYCLALCSYQYLHERYIQLAGSRRRTPM